MDENLIYIIFGATGDLTKRKLVPALYALFVQDLLPDKFVLLGASRSNLADQEFRSRMRDALAKFKDIEDDSKIDEFIDKLYYTSVDAKKDTDYQVLKERIESLRKEKEMSGNTVFYLSTPPSLYTVIPEHLGAAGLNDESDGWKRVIIEKPFGYDLESALALKDSLLKNWTEEQLYRIDHYLGKETVQNVMVTRFSNGIFEPLWNRNYIERVEITSAESIGIEGRGGYYDKSGALRDMVQNHLLQVAAITAMESPSSLDPGAIRNEILKVFQSVVIHFKSTPHFLFAQKEQVNKRNQLIIRIQPDEGILVTFGMKTPGAGFNVQNVNMDFHYDDLNNQRVPAAYERLIHDSIKGDSTLFARTEEVIAAWRFLDPVLKSWYVENDMPLFGYPAGTWGPDIADKLIEGEGATWRYPCKNLSDDGVYCEL